jgi:hypothetical protein
VTAGAAGGVTVAKKRLRASRRHVAHVAHEDGELDQVARRAADRLQGDVQVAKHLLGLCREVVLADQRPVAIERGLPGDEDDAARAHLDNL